MQITVRFTGPMRALAGRDTQLVVLPGDSRLYDLFEVLRIVIPSPFVEQVMDPIENQAGSLALVLVNRSQPRLAEGLAQELFDGDVVAFVPPMAGG